MFCYTVFIAITVFILSSTGIPTKSQTNEPERCCAPAKFSGQMITSTGVELPNGKGDSYYGTFNFSMDTTRGILGMRGVSLSLTYQHSSNLWVIEYLNGKVYTFDLDTKMCYKSAASNTGFRCIPDSATYSHSFTFGYGNKQIIGDTWLIKDKNGINYVTVSRDGLCVPLEGHYYSAQPPMSVSTTITDFHPVVDDPRIFDLPAECKNAVDVSGSLN